MIYFIQGETTKLIKIGYSRNPIRRFKKLKRTNSEDLRLLRIIRGTRADEASLHNKFKSLRKHNEWFNPNREMINYMREQDLITDIKEEGIKELSQKLESYMKEFVNYNLKKYGYKRTKKLLIDLELEELLKNEV